MGNFNDEHSGRGGSYLMGANGNRTLQERTEPVAAVNQETPAEGKPIKTNKAKETGNAKSN